MLLDLVVKACRFVSENPGTSGNASHLLSIALYSVACLAVAFTGLQGNLIERDYWKVASMMERGVVYSVDNLFKTGVIQFGGSQRVYLLDVPEILWSPRHSLYYVGNNSLEPDLSYRLGGAAEDVELIASAPIFEVMVRGERAFYRTLGHERMMEKEDVERLLAEGQIVLRFSPAKMTLERMAPNS